jgi:hypothetical protein
MLAPKPPKVRAVGRSSVVHRGPWDYW